MILRGKHYASGEPIEVHLAGPHIQKVIATSPPIANIYLAPALFDIQINGCLGISFNSPQHREEDIRHVLSVCQRHGLGMIFPTLVTAGFEDLRHGLKTIANVVNSDTTLRKSLPGIHLEGPYISPEDGPRGAHAREHVRPPDWEEFQRLQESAQGLIRLVTLAPEWPGASAFIAKLVSQGIVVALGHTAASREQIHAAIDAGAKLSTHLGNGAHANLPRHDNYIWEQLAADELWASMICDGFHLPKAVAKCLLRVKTPERTILTCDASPLAGLPPGPYREWNQDFEILPGGKIIVRGTSYLAGSGVFTDVCVGKVIDFTGIALREAVDMAMARPRELFGIPVPKIAEGESADLILFELSEDNQITIRTTIVGGNVVYQK